MINNVNGNNKIQQIMSSLENALIKLKEALAIPENNPLAIDGTIQRFELAFELYWKTFKKLLDQEGIEVNTPREVLRKAYAANWLDNEIIWLKMLQNRNETTRIYDEEKAIKIYYNIRDNFSTMEKTFIRIKNRVMENAEN